MCTKRWVQKQWRKRASYVWDCSRHSLSNLCVCVSFFWVRREFRLLSLRGARSKSEDWVVSRLMYSIVTALPVRVVCLWLRGGGGVPVMDYKSRPGTQRLSQCFDIGTFIMVRNGGTLHYFTFVLTYTLQYKTEWLLFNVLWRVFGVDSEWDPGSSPKGCLILRLWHSKCDTTECNVQWFSTLYASGCFHFWLLQPHFLQPMWKRLWMFLR